MTIKFLGFSVCLVAMLFLTGRQTPAQSQEQPFTAVVLNDVNADGIANGGEPQLADWEFTLFDQNYELLASATSNDDSLTEITDNGSGKSLCLTPQADWRQTAPVTTIGHPDDAAWYCFDATVPSDGPYIFMVAESIDDEPEEIPEIIVEESTEATDKLLPPEETGTVLGTTENNGEVLAETGIAAWLPLFGGICLFFLSVMLAYRTQTN